MNDAISILVRSLFQKDSLHDCSLEELQTIAREYPYFTPAQFLLAEKLKSTDEHLYKKQIQKLSLYFTNPLWLDYKMNGYRFETIPEPPQQAAHPMTESIQEKHESQSPDQGVAEKTVTHEEIIETPASAQEMESGVVGDVEEAGNGLPYEKHESPVPIHGDTDRIEDAKPITQNEQAEMTEAVDEQITEPIMDNISSHAHDAEAHEHSAAASDEAWDEEGESGPVAEEESAESQVLLPGLSNLSQEPTETDLTFEPYHTVDYFASQGIKFVPEEKPVDRFGQQLKSFTEWLKTLKRLPDTEIKMADVVSEEKVKELADHSISKDEVVTETMAEVWVKQGNKEKAIETYNKLSLLNPDKSAYFASLAEHLKNS